MKNHGWILLAAATSPMFLLACGDDTGASGAGGGGTGGAADGGASATSTTTAGSTTTAASTTTGSGSGGNGGDTGAGGDAGAGGDTSTGGNSGAGGEGGGLGCSGVLPDSCGRCVEAFCCTEAAECAAVEGCVDCYHDEQTCDDVSSPSADALYLCASQICPRECNLFPPLFMPTCEVPVVPPSAGECAVPDGQTSTCNPITNEPCAADEACDIEATGLGFRCFAPPPTNDALLCDGCSAEIGFCQGGLVCLDGGLCARYCCSDADCGTGVCAAVVNGVDIPGDVGICEGGN